MNSLLHDLRLGVRTLRKSPVLSAVAILTFALGIGVNVVIFSVVHAIAPRPLDVPDSDRVVRILNHDHGRRPRSLRDSSRAQRERGTHDVARRGPDRKTLSAERTEGA